MRYLWCLLTFLVGCELSTPIASPSISCASASDAWLSIGSVLQPHDCSRALIWATNTNPCFTGRRDDFVFGPEVIEYPCNSSGALVAVTRTRIVELWTDIGGCHCVTLGTNCAVINDNSAIFAIDNSRFSDGTTCK